jgi:hypothetical protein
MGTSQLLFRDVTTSEHVCFGKHMHGMKGGMISVGVAQIINADRRKSNKIVASHA